MPERRMTAEEFGTILRSAPLVTFYERPSHALDTWRWETLRSNLLNSEAWTIEGWRRRLRYARTEQKGRERHRRVKYCRDHLRRLRKAEAKR